MIQRSFIIPVLDMSPHSQFNIQTLLEDLSAIEGEVICIFNSPEVFRVLHDHPRIGKYCFNKLNAGVSRSWNLGINMAEGRSVFILNADLHVRPEAIEQMEAYLHQLPDAVLVGPQGSYLDFEGQRIIHYFQKGTFNQPVRTHDVSGFFFAIHLQRFLDYKLCFDVRYSPCFMEEWDMGVQVMKAGLSCYTVPVDGWEHEWGISGAKDDRPIQYFGRTVMRNDVLIDNRHKFKAKWFPAQPVADDASSALGGR
ncbi:MAG: glycosyltransferase family 2 protein [Desulfobacteraceae bacterium]|nr:MAG: glycosyltransferase family 2 protein [Desulfobacteraceae bacterium]